LSLQEGTTDPVAKFDRLRERVGEQWVHLDDPITIYLTYRTVWFDDAGTHHFRTDVYRRDQVVAAALAEAGVAFGS
jgi:murein L,D-transpeptidase YcbB/YkuD